MQTFSMEADTTTKANQSNTFEVNLADGTELKEGTRLRLLRSAVVYGANASGKTNFIRAFHTLKLLITHSGTFKVGDLIKGYYPFGLEEGYDTKPSTFQELVNRLRRIFNLDWDEFKPQLNMEKFVITDGIGF